MEAVGSGSPVRKAPRKVNWDRERCCRVAEQRDGELKDWVRTGGFEEEKMVTQETMERRKQG